MSRLPPKRTTTGYVHGPDPSGPTGFGFVVRDRRRRKVVAWTWEERSARLLAWALTMRELMAESANQQFLDWGVAWLGELTGDCTEGGRMKPKP